MIEPKNLNQDVNTERENLLHEHEQLVALFIHEDWTAWQLTITLIVGNAAVIGSTYILGLLDPKTLAPQLPFVISIVIGLGILLNILGFFVLQRSKIHWQSRLFRGYAIEARLWALGSSVTTFNSAEGNISRNVMLQPDGMTTRQLCWYERVEPLGFRIIFIALSIVFAIILMWLWLGRPGI